MEGPISPCCHNRHRQTPPPHSSSSPRRAGRAPTNRFGPFRPILATASRRGGSLRSNHAVFAIFFSPSFALPALGGAEGPLTAAADRYPPPPPHLWPARRGSPAVCKHLRHQPLAAALPKRSAHAPGPLPREACWGL